MLKPLFGADDDEWVVLVGRYMLNMGAIEMATRLLIVEITGLDQEPIYSDDLSARVRFLRKKFPRTEPEKHSKAMQLFLVAEKLSGFRNIVAHSAIVLRENELGERVIQGVFSITPKSKTNKAELIGIDEMRGRVTESAAVGSAMLEMQGQYTVSSATNSLFP